MLMWCQQKRNLETKWFLLKQTNQMVQASSVLMKFSANPILWKKTKCVKAGNHKFMMCEWISEQCGGRKALYKGFIKEIWAQGSQLTWCLLHPPSACRLGAFMWKRLVPVCTTRWEHNDFWVFVEDFSSPFMGFAPETFETTSLTE